MDFRGNKLCLSKIPDPYLKRRKVIKLNSENSDNKKKEKRKIGDSKQKSLTVTAYEGVVCTTQIYQFFYVALK